MIERRARVVITGIGPALAGSSDSDSFWNFLNLGTSQCSEMAHPYEQGRKIKVGAIRCYEPSVELNPPLNEDWFKNYPRQIQFYLASVMNAVKDSRWRIGELVGDKIGIYEGSSRGPHAYHRKQFHREEELGPSKVHTTKSLIYGLAGQAGAIAALNLGATGPCISFNGGCTAAAVAAGYAFNDIQAGFVDQAVVTGHDFPLSTDILATYLSSAIISTNGAHDSLENPYNNHRESNLILGEGAMSMVFENEHLALAQGRTILAEIDSVINGTESSDVLKNGQDLKRVVKLFERCLARANCALSDIDFVVGHGNGSVMSDCGEQMLREQIFGARSNSVPWITTKPIYGHGLATSGVVNIAAATQILNRKTMFQNPISQPFTPPQSGQYRRGLAFSWGLGGKVSIASLKSYNP